MKKIIYIATLVSILIMSCSKDFIEIPPVSTVSIDQLFNTDKDFQDAVIGCYNVIQNQYKDMYLFSEIRGDDAWQEVIRGISSYFSDTFTITSDDAALKSTWGNYYSLIFRANSILSKIDGADVSIVTNKERHIAEAKFLRALAYFDLVRIFGDVPKITTPVTIKESYEIGRESVDNIYDEIIIPDLLAAESGLSLKYTGTDVGRPTKGAAKALLGKVYLTIHDFQKAEAKLQEVTTMGYALLPNFNDLFNYTKDEHHSEYVFDMEYVSGGLGEGSPWTALFIPMSPELAAFLGIVGYGSFFNPTQNIVHSFMDNDPNDLRFNITVDTLGGFFNNEGKFIKFVQEHTYTKKYIVKTFASNDSPANWKVIRYADVLLMYAEALNENGKTGEALTYLNMVHTRAGLTGYSGLTKEDTREKIYLERRLELAFEGHSWFDLVRIGRAYSVMQQYGMKPYMTVFPIPLSQIQVVNNLAIFAQNPGYE